MLRNHRFLRPWPEPQDMPGASAPHFELISAAVTELWANTLTTTWDYTVT